MGRSLLVALVLVLGCGAPGAESRTGSAGSSGPEAYRITSFELGPKIDGKVVSRRVFSRTEALFLAARIDAHRPGQVLRVAWRAPGDDRPVQEDSVDLTPGENSVELPLRQLGLGRNGAEVSIDGDPVAQASFEIREAYEPSFTDEPASGPGVEPPRLRRPAVDAEPPPEELAGADFGPGLLIVRCLVTREGTTESCVVILPVKGANAPVLRWLARQRWEPALLNSTLPVDIRYIFNFRKRPTHQ